MMPQYQFQQFVPMVQQQVGQKLYTLYVGDLEDQIDDNMLFIVFSKFGNIVQLKIARDFENRRSKGFGFVTYANQKEADRARMEMNHQVILNNPLRVCNKKPPQELSQDANIVIKNIPSNVTISEVDTLFQKFGDIFSSRLIQKTGVAFVQYENKDSVQKCLEIQSKQPLKLNNQVLSIFPFQKRMMCNQNTNIYLKNFPAIQPEVIEETLKKYCSKFGPLSSLLIKPHSDLSLPFAFVCFPATEHAQECFEALKVNPPFPNLYVNWAESRQERNRKLKSALSQVQNETNLFVKNLKQSVTREQLHEKMSKYGQITSCEVKLPDIKGQQMIITTKFGFVNFKNKEDARNALLMAREQPDIKELFQDAQVYINYHLLKSQSMSYQNMRKNKMMPFLPNMNMIQSMPQMNMMNMQQQNYGRQPQPIIQPMHQLQIPNMMNPIQMPMMNMPMMNMPMQNMPYMNRQKQTMQPILMHQKPPMQKIQQQQPILKQKDFGSYEQINKNKEVFMKKPIDYQRSILGELLFPMIQEIISPKDKEYVPKITGMLIDFSVFEVDDILELFEDKEALKERVQEAVDLIQQNQQN